MEVDDIQTPQPACKLSRVNSNGRIDPSKIAHHNHHLDDSDEVVRRSDHPATALGQGGGEAVVGTNQRLRQWQHSSRIIRVSRASGGKDRHSKVWTAKGPRDRRVRLSVTTAIQFYDLQDRLGYDQPSKAVEWLIKAAADAINELPSLNSSCTFPPPKTPSPRQLSDEHRRAGAGVLDVVDSGEPSCYNQNQNQRNQNHQQQQQQQMGSSSMSSEASKGSGLSLSRSEIRVKARERARERIAKEKEKEKERESKPTVSRVNSNVGSNNLQQTSSFTQLLMAGVNNLNESNAAGSSSPSPGSASAHQGLRSGTTNQWLTSASTTAMDYFRDTVGLMAGNASSSPRSTSGYSTGLIQVGSQVMSISPFSIGSHHHQQEPQHDSEELHHHQHHQQQQQHLPFMADHHQQLIQQATPNTANGGGNGAGEYNLNFSISSSSTSNSGGQLNGFSSVTSSNNGGPLQSNSPSLLPYLTKFSTDGSSVPFFLGGTAVENHNHSHHHQQQFHPPGLQLCYGGDGAATHRRRGKEKSSTATTTATVTATTKSFSSNHSNLWAQVNNDGAA